MVTTLNARQRPAIPAMMTANSLNMMAVEYDRQLFHGARVKENTDLQTAINDIDSTVIGLVAVAEDADPPPFHLTHRCL
jgi:hypothetical protein